MEPQRRLYLFGGQTYILVPKSSWLNELKAHPTGITALKAIENTLLLKEFIKVSEIRDPNSHAVQTEWFHEEHGTRLKVAVNPDGQLTVNGKPIGSTTSGDTFKQLEKMSETAGKWVTAVREVINEKGQKIRVPHKFFIPPDKVRKTKLLEPGMGTRKPEDLFPKKGGPHPSSDVLSQKATAMNQLIGQYTTPLLKAEDREESLRRCNLMLELAAKEENEEECKRLCEEVERQLQRLEACER